MDLALTLKTIVLCLIIRNPSEASTFEEDVTLTTQQKVELDKFKATVSSRLPHDYMKEDIYLINWLKVRNFNRKEAESMLMENLKWREEQRMDTIHEEDWSDFASDYRYWLEGSDRQGRPILYMDIGTHDVRKAVVTGRTAKYLRFVNKCMDETCNLVRTLGQKYRNITRGQMIVDLNGFNLVQHSCLQCIPVIINIVTSYEKHFPRCADQIILLNAPRIFEPLLNAFRAVASPDTRKSLKIYGRNRKVWQEAMSKDFDFNELPPSLGGTKNYTDLDEN